MRSGLSTGEPLNSPPEPPRQPPRLRTLLVAWGPAATWAAVLFLLSEIRGVPLSTYLASHDKIVHGVLYAVLGVLLGWAWYAAGQKLPHLAVIGLGWIYGLVDEFHQMFVPNRIPSVGDWVADAVGVVIGYVTALLILLAFARARGVGTPAGAETKT